MNPINRESLKNGLLQKIAVEAERNGLIHLTSAEEREASWRNTLATNPNADGAVWVFAYGSLLWNPAIHVAEHRDAMLEGYHRDFTLRTYIGRGSKEQPGLVLGLETGGHCQGQILRVLNDCVESELNLLWSREMVASAYVPTWLPVKTKAGEELFAIAFLMDVNYPHYVAHLTFEERCHDLAIAEGALGAAAEYLFSTVETLEKLGIHDELLVQYASRVSEIQNGDCAV
jgi:cation transport protein ChaC